MAKKICALAVAVALLGGAATAQTWEPQPSAEGRYCRYADVVGLWDSTLQRADEKGVAQQNAVAPHDYLRFRADGGMMYFGTNRALSDVRQIHARLDALDRTDGATYRAEIATPGVLIIRRDGAPFQGFTCLIGRNGGGGPAMIWTELRGQPKLRRTQARLD